MSKKILSLVLITFVLSNLTVKAQSTFEHIHNLIQTHCSSCHNGTTNPLNFNVSMGDLYSTIVGVTPLNPHAAAKGDQLIYPGYPERSFLLRKISHGIDQRLALEPQEGGLMPTQIQSLNKYDIETVRQWILRGAPETGNVVNRAMLQEFYTEGGLEISHIPPAPDPSEGFQAHFGPVFLAPLAEEEYMKVYPVENDQKIEVNRIDVFMNWQSHHYILYRYNDPAHGASTDQGLRPIDMATLLGEGGKNFVSAWQFTDDQRLPENTAFFWDVNTHLDLNYHIKNYDTEKILKAEVYMNVYFKPEQSITDRMYSILHNYNYVNPLGLFWIPGGATRIFTEASYNANASETDSMYIYMLTSHTHKFGKDYKIYLRNPDGSKGEMIYDGLYNTDYTFNQGFYDYEHPAIRYFSPMRAVALRDGLIHEATYQNTSSTGVGFGLTTADEMMIYLSQYTLKRPDSDTLTVSVDELDIAEEKPLFELLSNPVSEYPRIRVNHELQSDLSILIYNNLGQIVWNGAFDNATIRNNDNLQLTLSGKQLDSGTYFIRIIAGQKMETLPFIKL